MKLAAPSSWLFDEAAETVSDQRIAALVDAALAETRQPRPLLDRIVANGIAGGLEWHEIVTAVDEAERRTGLPLHPAGMTTAQ